MSAAIYTRQSRDKTGLEAGVMRQLKECRQLAKDRDTAVDFELSDNDISATTGKLRPDFEKLLSLVEQGAVDTVIVWHTDRLYRKLRDLVRLVDMAENHKLNIVTVKAGELDLNTSTGRMLAGILGSVASQEGEHRTDRQRTTFRDNAEKGIWHFSHRPFGYHRTAAQKGANPTVVEAEAQTVREMYRWYYADGRSYYWIAHTLNDQKRLSVDGNEWTITSVRTVLQNGRYAGICYYRGKEVGVGGWEPIISRDEWAAYTGAAARRKVGSTFTRAATSLLSGLIFCDVCGSKCYRKQRGTDGFELRCIKNHVSISSRQAEPKVRTEVIAALLTGPNAIIPRDDYGQDLGSIGNAIEKLDGEREDLLALHADKLITTTNLRPRLQAIKDQTDQLVRARDSILQSSTAAGMLEGLKGDLFSGGTASFSDAATARVHIAQRFDELELAKKRELVSLLVDLRLARGWGAQRLLVTHKVVAALNDQA